MMGAHHSVGSASDWRYYFVLHREVLELPLVGEWDSVHTKRLGVASERNVKCFPWHGADVAVKDGWEFRYNLLTC